jgi:hypothetical protein
VRSVKIVPQERKNIKKKNSGNFSQNPFWARFGTASQKPLKFFILKRVGRSTDARSAFKAIVRTSAWTPGAILATSRHDIGLMPIHL